MAAVCRHTHLIPGDVGRRETSDVTGQGDILARSGRDPVRGRRLEVGRHHHLDVELVHRLSRAVLGLTRVLARVGFCDTAGGRDKENGETVVIADSIMIVFIKSTVIINCDKKKSTCNQPEENDCI